MMGGNCWRGPVLVLKPRVLKCRVLGNVEQKKKKIQHAEIAWAYTPRLAFIDAMPEKEPLPALSAVH